MSKLDPPFSRFPWWHLALTPLLALGTQPLTPPVALSPTPTIVPQEQAPPKSCTLISQLIEQAKLKAKALGEKVTVVRVPVDTYVCKEPLVLQDDGIQLIGGEEESNHLEKNRPTLRLANNVNSPVMIIGSPHTRWLSLADSKIQDFFTVETPDSDKIKIVRNIRVSGFNVDGNMANQWQECWTPKALARFPRNKEDPISNATCTGEGPSAIRNNGITIRGAEDIEVSHVTLYENASGGMVTEKHSKRLLIHNMIARNNWFDGFAGYQTEDSIIADSQLIENQGAGASLDLNFNDNIFENVVFGNNGHQGLFLRQLNSNQISNSLIRCNGYQGLFFASSYSDGIDTALIRLKARELQYKVPEPSLEIALPIMEKILVQEREEQLKAIAEQRVKEPLLFNMTQIELDANKFQKSQAQVLHDLYHETVKQKRLHCANQNAMLNTEIICSGRDRWGSGIRINDDECEGNGIDSKTVELFSKIPADKINPEGDYTIGTRGRMNLNDPKDLEFVRYKGRVDHRRWDKIKEIRKSPTSSL